MTNLTGINNFHLDIKCTLNYCDHEQSLYDKILLAANWSFLHFPHKDSWLDCRCQHPTREMGQRYLLMQFQISPLHCRDYTVYSHVYCHAGCVSYCSCVRRIRLFEKKVCWNRSNKLFLETLLHYSSIQLPFLDRFLWNASELMITTPLWQ